jgi:hypothetical protein
VEDHQVLGVGECRVLGVLPVGHLQDVALWPDGAHVRVRLLRLHLGHSQVWMQTVPAKYLEEEVPVVIAVELLDRG